MSYTVVKAHALEPGDPFVISRGTRVTWERRPTQWNGWLFCQSGNGAKGWVPEAWLTLDGSDAEIDRDYDATELAASVGDVIDGELVESGWLLARDGSGRAGWLPLDCLQASS